MGDSLKANGVTVYVEELDMKVGSDFPIMVVAGNRGLIKRTTSGEPRRRHMWQLLQAGVLPSTAVVVAASERGGYSSPISLA